MTKTSKRTQISDNRFRYRVVVTQDEECVEGTALSNRLQEEFMLALARQPSILHCGFSRYKRCLIRHNGLCWQAEAEAEVEEAA